MSADLILGLAAGVLLGTLTGQVLLVITFACAFVKLERSQRLFMEHLVAHRDADITAAERTREDFRDIVQAVLDAEDEEDDDPEEGEEWKKGRRGE